MFRVLAGLTSCFAETALTLRTRTGCCGQMTRCVSERLPNNGLNPTAVAMTVAADSRGELAPAAGYAGRSADKGHG
jgi:hypothetical protein